MLRGGLPFGTLRASTTGRLIVWSGSFTVNSPLLVVKQRALRGPHRRRDLARGAILIRDRRHVGNSRQSAYTSTGPLPDGSRGFHLNTPSSGRSGLAAGAAGPDLSGRPSRQRPACRLVNSPATPQSGMQQCPCSGDRSPPLLSHLHLVHPKTRRKTLSGERQGRPVDTTQPSQRIHFGTDQRVVTQSDQPSAICYPHPRAACDVSGSGFFCLCGSRIAAPAGPFPRGWSYR